jgi:hydroxymethylbilane synthase
MRVLATLNDAETRSGVEAERAALAGLEGGCQVSIGAWGRIENGKLVLEVAVLSPDGAQRLWEKGWGAPEEANSIGARVAQTLRENGAAALLARESRGTRA